MKSLIFRSKTIIIAIALLAYAVWLIVQSKAVAGTDMNSLVALIVSGAIALYMIAIIVFPTVIPDNRRQIALLGIGIILFAHMYIQDNPSQHVYLSDIMKLIGVFLIITGPMKLLVSQKAIEKKQEEQLEIIEA